MGLILMVMIHSYSNFANCVNLYIDHLRWRISLAYTWGIRLSSSSSSSSCVEVSESWRASKLWEDGTASVGISKLDVKLPMLLIRLFEADELLAEYAGWADTTPMLCSWSTSCCACWWWSCELCKALANANLLFISWLCTIASSDCNELTFTYTYTYHYI